MTIGVRAHLRTWHRRLAGAAGRRVLAPGSAFRLGARPTAPPPTCSVRSRPDGDFPRPATCRVRRDRNARRHGRRRWCSCWPPGSAAWRLAAKAPDRRQPARSATAKLRDRRPPSCSGECQGAAACSTMLGRPAGRRRAVRVHSSPSGGREPSVAVYDGARRRFGGDSRRPPAADLPPRCLDGDWRNDGGFSGRARRVCLARTRAIISKRDANKVSAVV